MRLLHVNFQPPLLPPSTREAYTSVVVQTINSGGVAEGLRLEPVVNETQDLQEIAPCEPPPPGIYLLPCVPLYS